MQKKELYGAIATLVGMIIGAGILGIPYVVAKAGFITGLIDILVLGFSVLLINLYLGEVALRTQGSHQLTGYAKIYLGRGGEYLMIFSMVFGMYGALIAYILKEGEFLSKLFSPVFGGNNVIYSLIFFIVMSILIYEGLKIIERSELLMVTLILAIIVIIVIFSFSYINPSNLEGFDISKIFIPYGVVLFAFIGTAAIPELKEELKYNKNYLKKAIIYGSLIPIAVYIIFALIVVGVTGIENITDGAIIGLSNVLGYKMLLFGAIFGILTMGTSFLAIGLALKEMYNFDFKYNKTISASLACIVPLIIALIIVTIKINNAFFKVLDLTGAVTGSLAGILIVLMIFKAKKVGKRKPEYSIKGSKVLGIFLILLFILGLLYEILRLLRIINV
jgi:tyrosine-specific transport protein